ncbi:pilus assembly protein TadG-related protein [Variovorax sp. ZS18.2.2]|uniref:TadG family pilus assembly protein n=1 Tax=Variovorax sp. ZS18.2.2 TaxID=2971255 RepID=UPI002151D5C9|nr:TadG family pilus assembly protein [Variovorax sp. ZS18.2.2]MCR6479717.1 pilus assembly protein TadG-related protein [Variovorax sp. ZS18.2.2]
MDTAHQNSLHRSAGQAPGARRRARGSIVVNTVIALSLVVITLLGTQIGYLMLMKRELQKTADLAALSGAQSLLPLSCVDARTAAVANAAQNMPPMLPPLAAADVECGNWDPQTREAPQHFGAPNAGQFFNAVRVRLSRTPALLIPNLSGGQSFTITVQALAAQRQPLASLSIRSTLLTIDTKQSDLLNAVFGGLLGGSLTVRAGGWQGLLNTNIQLLSFLDQLKLDLNISAVNYDQVLNTEVDAGVLLQAMITVMERGGNTANIALLALRDVLVSVQASPFTLKLGDLLGVATGTDAAGLSTDLQLFQLVQGMIQVANGKNGLAATVPITVPGVASVTTKLQVIEPPQVSAVGNPSLINANLGVSDPNKIYVRTAQIRLLMTVDLGGVANLLTDVLSAVTGAISPLISFLDSVVTLNLGTIVTDLVGLVGCGGLLPACQPQKVIYAATLPSPIDIGISSGNGSAIVTGHACNATESKSLNVQANTSVARLNIGKVSNIFSSSLPATAEPVGIVEIGYREAKFDSCLLLSLFCSGKKWRAANGSFVPDMNNAKKTVISGLGLVVNSDIGGSVNGTPLTYVAPGAANLPEIDAAPYDGVGADPSFKAISATSIVQSLGSTLGGIQIKPYSSDTSGILGGLLNGTFTLVSNLLNTLQTIVTNALGPLLDPTVNALLDLLGIDLAQAEVGARMSCNRGAELVY